MLKLSALTSSLGSSLSSSLGDSTVVIHWVVYVLGKLALIIAVALVFQAAVRIESRSRIQLPTIGGTTDTTDVGHRVTQELAAYNVISERNLFAQRKKDIAPEAQQETKLELRLVGVIITSGATPIAIIEDKKKKVEEVFEVNEKVFDQATLVEVQHSFVRLERNGVKEILNLDDGSGGKGEGIIASSDAPNNFVVEEKELNDALSNLPLLLSQARAVPYFEGGQSVGMRLFAIRQGSLYEKIGLKNGDIIKAVNGNTLTDMTQAMKLFEALRTERSITVKVVRNGNDMDLSYAIQ